MFKFEKPTRIRDKNHLAFIRKCPCVRCIGRMAGHHSVVAHHITIGTNRGIALKAGDDYCVSLCDQHHKYLHQHGEISFWGDKLDSAITLAKSLYEVTGQRDKAIELIKGAGL